MTQSYILLKLGTTPNYSTLAMTKEQVGVYCKTFWIYVYNNNSTKKNTEKEKKNKEQETYNSQKAGQRSHMYELCECSTYLFGGELIYGGLALSVGCREGRCC